MENKKILATLLTLLFFTSLPNAVQASDNNERKRTERPNKKTKAATKKAKVNTVDKLTLLQQKADDGDVEAQIELGDLTEPNSFVEAMNWFVTAADQKSKVAVERLESLNDKIKTAIRTCKSREQRTEHLDALFQLGCTYLDHESVLDNVPLACATLEFAAQYKHAKSELMLAKLNYNGARLNPNPQISMEWLYRAMKHNPELRETKYFKQLNKLATQVAKEKNGRGQYIMGKILQLGWGVTPDLQRAHAMFELSAAQGEAKACYQAGKYLAREWKHPSKYEAKRAELGKKAVGYFIRGAALDHQKSFHELGLCSLRGTCGLAENPIEAVRWITGTERRLTAEWTYNRKKEGADRFFERTLQRRHLPSMVESDSNRPVPTLPELTGVAPIFQHICTAIQNFEGELKIVGELLDQAPILVNHYQLCPGPELEKALRQQDNPCFMHRSRFEGYTYLTMDAERVPDALRVERIFSPIPFITDVLYDSKMVVRALAAHAKWTAAESLKATEFCDVDESEALLTHNLQGYQIESFGRLKSFMLLMTQSYQMAYERIVGQKEGFHQALGDRKPTNEQKKKLEILKAAEEFLWTQVHTFQRLSKPVLDLEESLYWKIRNVEPRNDVFDETTVGRSLARYVKEDME